MDGTFLSMADHCHSITLFERTFEFDPYYFALAGEASGLTTEQVMDHVVCQWGDALERLKDASEVALLPIGVYDECLECIEATLVERNLLRIRSVWMQVDGYSLDLLDLGSFMSTHQTNLQGENFGPRVIGVFDQSLVIANIRRQHESELQRAA